MAQFSIPLAQLAEKAKLALETVARKATLDLFAAVVRRSPVGNPSLWKGGAPKGYVGGRFRANWNVSFGAVNVGTTTSTNQARADGEVAKVLSLPIGGVTFLANGLPYANELEYGHSKQAPAGMVRLAKEEFSRFIEQAAKATR